MGVNESLRATRFLLHGDEDRIERGIIELPLEKLARRVDMINTRRANGHKFLGTSEMQWAFMVLDCLLFLGKITEENISKYRGDLLKYFRAILFRHAGFTINKIANLTELSQASVKRIYGDDLQVPSFYEQLRRNYLGKEVDFRSKSKDFAFLLGAIFAQYKSGILNNDIPQEVVRFRNKNRAVLLPLQASLSSLYGENVDIKELISGKGFSMSRSNIWVDLEIIKSTDYIKRIPLQYLYAEDDKKSFMKGIFFSTFQVHVDNHGIHTVCVSDKSNNFPEQFKNDFLAICDDLGLYPNFGSNGIIFSGVENLRELIDQGLIEDSEKREQIRAYLDQDRRSQRQSINMFKKVQAIQLRTPGIPLNEIANELGIGLDLLSNLLRSENVKRYLAIKDYKQSSEYKTRMQHAVYYNEFRYEMKHEDFRSTLESIREKLKEVCVSLNDNEINFMEKFLPSVLQDIDGKLLLFDGGETDGNILYETLFDMRMDIAKVLRLYKKIKSKLQDAYDYFIDRSEDFAEENLSAGNGYRIVENGLPIIGGVKIMCISDYVFENINRIMDDVERLYGVRFTVRKSSERSRDYYAKIKAKKQLAA